MGARVLTMNRPVIIHMYTVCIYCYRSDFYDRRSGTLKQVFALNNLDSQLQSKLMVGTEYSY